MSLSIPEIRQLADVSNPSSFSNRMRFRRFQLFESLIATLPRPLRILDVGGTNLFWENRDWVNRDDIQIVTLNLQAEPKSFSNIESVIGDATDLSQFADASFDIVFSNSVIEHLFTLENQRRMAAEVQRVGKAIWVQTPNFWFPIEPHFLVPGWQWLPTEVRVRLIRRWRCGHRGPCTEPVRARQLVTEVRLMTRAELRQAFPGADLVPERFLGLAKSWVVIYGFPLDLQGRPKLNLHNLGNR
ncbi:MAG: SAM-dependent methyltransferase [Acidobacteria bacterium]|nr:MAG: SAM-dependent methyltransferase [Acidobacteriota bacterium]